MCVFAQSRETFLIAAFVEGVSIHPSPKASSSVGETPQKSIEICRRSTCHIPSETVSGVPAIKPLCSDDNPAWKVRHQATSATPGLCRSFIAGERGCASLEMARFSNGPYQFKVVFSRVLLVWDSLGLSAHGCAWSFAPGNHESGSKTGSILSIRCRLFWQDGRTLEAYGVDRNSTIHLHEAQPS